MDSAGSLPHFLRRAADLFETLPETRQGAPALRQIATSTDQPFNLAVVGRMKTGKSTLINSLIGRPLAATDVEEATATINWLCHGTGLQTFQMIVEWKDGRTEGLPLTRLVDWIGKTPEVIDRVGRTALLRLFSDADRLREMQIIDTPGTGSAVEAHETTALAFLSPDVIVRSVAEGRKADAILYVVSPVGRDSDVENLDLFQGDRLPNSGPYNSVCVVHKWDALKAVDPAAEAAVKAARLRDQFSDMVADVIPVSGPIALAAKSALDDSYVRLLDCTGQLGTPELENLLKNSDRWDRDGERASVRKLFALPWASFTLVVRQVREVTRGDIATARLRCLEYSRIADLEKFIEDRFFSQARIIKQCSALEKAQQIYAPSIRRIAAEGERLEQDAALAKRAAIALPSQERGTAGWLEAKGKEWNARSENLCADALSLDREWQQHGADLDGLLMDLRVSETMDREPTLFPLEDHARIRALCNHLAIPHLRSQLGGQTLVSLPELQRLIDAYRAKENRAPRKSQPLFEHILRRLEEAFRVIEPNLAQKQT
jgi:hypothetical protein